MRPMMIKLINITLKEKREHAMFYVKIKTK